MGVHFQVELSRGSQGTSWSCLLKSKTEDQNPNHGPPAKKRKILEASQESENPGEIAEHLAFSISSKFMPFEGKIGCIEAIDALISKNLQDQNLISESLSKKELIEELDKVTKEIIYKVGNGPDKTLTSIARIFAKIEKNPQGKKFIQELEMCPRFKTEMKKFREITNPEDFEFDSDQNGTQVKPEVVEIKMEDEWFAKVGKFLGMFFYVKIV